MNKQEGLKLLGEYIRKIADENLRELTQQVLERAPHYFWTVPASISGKYHPSDERGEGGTILHILRVSKLAEILMTAWLTPFDSDVIRAACLLHDTCKYGSGNLINKTQYPRHPQEASALIREILKEHPVSDDFERKVEEICLAVERHMGKWTDGAKPDVDEQWIVHLADMVACNYQL